jgi:hypothetical protein
MTFEIATWRAFVTAAVFLLVFFHIRQSLQLRAIHADLVVMHRLLMAWAMNWGGSTEEVRAALAKAMQPPL